MAKGWCETIRASQVIPVYPLTADLRPGDVFLVQTSSAAQADLYRRRGFLPLDDHRARLVIAPDAYGRVYFDGFFADPYKGPPHTYPTRTAGTLAAGTHAQLSTVDAPRVAFPTYTFDVRSGIGGALALPIACVPVGLSLLRSKAAKGSVTIADARTYSADEGLVLEALHTWAEANRKILRSTAQLSIEHVYLRVVTRVYLAGAVVVSLSRASAAGAGGAIGKPPAQPALPDLTNADGSLNPNWASVLAEINKVPDPVSKLEERGGGFRFLSTSSTTVTMSESFDTLLAIGYLGLDVPIDADGGLGTPVPTFQRLEGTVTLPNDYADVLTSDQERFDEAVAMVESLGKSDPLAAARVMDRVVDNLNATQYDRVDGTYHESARTLIEEALRASGADRPRLSTIAFRVFRTASAEYVSEVGRSGSRFSDFAEVVADALEGFPARE